MEKIENLYREERKNLVNSMYRKTGNYHVAEDIVQEAFTRAIKFLPAYKEDRGAFRKWFNSILYNTLADFQKDERNSGMKMGTVDINMVDVWEDVGVTAREESRNNLLPAIHSYTTNQKHREVLELFYVMGYSSTEIGQIMEGVTPSNVTTIAKRFKDSASKRG